MKANTLLVAAGVLVSLSGTALGEAGFKNGKLTISEGEENKLTIGGWAQFRYQMNFRDGSANSDDDFTHGFENRRVRLEFAGTIADKNLSYFISGDFSRSTGAFILFDANASYKWENGFAVKWGQFKPPLQREESIGDTNQLTVERSTMNQVFSQSRAQGIELSYTKPDYRFMLAFTDGIGTLNTAFDGTSGAEADWALTARGEARWGEGDWNRFRDFTSWRDANYAGLAGLAIHAQGGGDTNPANTPATDRRLLQVTADAQIEGAGWNAFVAGAYRSVDLRGVDAFDDFGLLAQFGIFVSEQAEVFARYDVVVPDGDRTGGNDAFNTITVGGNYYISPKSHAVKFTGDLIYFINAQGDAASIVAPNSGQNLLASPDDGQFGVRLQMQVMF